MPFATFDPESSSWKTSVISLFEESTSFSATWPLKGSMRSGAVFERRTSVPLTDGSGSSSLLGTPRATRGGSSTENAGKLLPTPRSQDAKHAAATDYELFDRDPAWDLIHQAVTRLLPTPQARDWKDGANPKPHGEHSPSLPVFLGERMRAQSDDGNAS